MLPFALTTHVAAVLSVVITAPLGYVITAPLDYYAWKRDEVVRRRQEISVIDKEWFVYVQFQPAWPDIVESEVSWLGCFLFGDETAFEDVEIQCWDTRGKLALLGQLSTLKRLRLMPSAVSRIRQRGAQELASVARLTQVKRLILEGCDIEDGDMSRLMHLTGLEVLDLRDTLVTDVGLRRIVGMKALRVLLLGAYSKRHHGRPIIGDAGMDYISQLNSLQVLDLLGTNVSDTGLKKLASLRDLKCLELRHTRVTKDAAREMRTARRGLLICTGTSMLPWVSLGRMFLELNGYIPEASEREH